MTNTKYITKTELAGYQGTMKILAIVNAVAKHTAPIRIQMNYTTPSMHIEHDTVLIQECPPALINELIAHGYALDVDANGVRVR